jgi:ribosomal subunit interface protein
MSLQVTGKNMRVGESFQSYVSDRLDGAAAKYVGTYLAAHVRVEKERGRFQTSCSVQVRAGAMLESSGVGDDAYTSAGVAFEHLEKRLRRYKRRLKNRHHGATNDPDSASGAVDRHTVELRSRETAAELPGLDQDAPLIIAETDLVFDELTVSEAAVRLGLTEEAFLVFRNASSGEMNVVYCRADGNIGWIDAAMPAKSGAIAEPSAGAESAVAMGRPSTRQSVGSRSKRST